MSRSRRQPAAFTLVELLIVVAIIAMLVSVLLPSLSAAREMAKVAVAHAELSGVGTALELFAEDHAGRYPPVRCYCNPDVAADTCKLPVELGAGGYLPAGGESGMETAVQDVFNPGHTYKYKAPGDMVFNDGLPVGESFEVWVPRDFPNDPVGGDPRATDDLVAHRSPATSPVSWVVYSVGPRPASEKVVTPRMPIARNTWYGGVGDAGVIVRIKGPRGTYVSRP